MELKNNPTLGKEESENPYLSSNVKDILKRKKEKSKKAMKKIDLFSMTNENENNEPEKDNENESEKMLDDGENNNKNNIELEKKAKKNYKDIYSQHNNLDINFNTKIENIFKKNKKNQKSTLGTCCKETFFVIMNIISFAFLYLSFTKRSDNDIIYYYFIYPINKISFIYLSLSASITSFIIILIKINKISLFHIFYSAIFHMWMFSKYHLVNKNKTSINYFDPANCHFFIYFIVMIHTLGILFILYNIAYYFYLSGQFNKNENNICGLLIDYWESERKIAKLEKYINSNLDQLITSKGYIHEENIINKKKNSKVIWRIIFLGFIILLVHILLLFKKYAVFNCDYLNKGIISNSDDDLYCKFTRPTGYCYMNTLLGFFDKFDNMNKCDDNTKSEEKENLINELKDKYNNKKVTLNTKLFGYPLTNNQAYYFDEIGYKKDSKLQEKINQEIFDINGNSEVSPEVILDYSDEKNPKLNINLHYNEGLSNSRKRLETNETLFENVFVVYLSGVSQFYFKNALPKLSSFISIYENKGPNDSNNLSMNSFQFKRYHSFTNESFSNNFLMFFDPPISSLDNIKPQIYNNFANINNHLQYFMENGYVMGQAVDTCYSYEHQISSNKIHWDHENLALSCDPNYLKNINDKNYCIYGNPFYSYHINYAEQFWVKYKNNRKYFRLSFNNVNEKSGSLLTYLDEPLYDLFVKLKFNGYLNNTAIFFISEYGGGQENILYKFGIHNEKEINDKFGTFILVMSKNNKLSENEKKIVYDNQNKMVTPFDIYASLVNIPLGKKISDIKLNVDEKNKGKSIFKEIDGKQRNYAFFKEFWVDEKYCACSE